MRAILPFILSILPGLAASAAVAASRDVSNVAWNSSSANHHGSMPLGDGDIAINPSLTRDGELPCCISQTDWRNDK